MGIPGILKEIGKGERKALSKLAVEHLERHNRPLRIAIDAAIWNFQTQSGQGGKNPALRTLFFRLLRLLALPIQPVFVYDGKNKPLTKRGRTVSRYNGFCVPNELSKDLVKRFAWPSHVAPGEAEAECALLQKKGIVDAVMSQDVDAIMFGAGITLRDWSKEGTRGNKTPTHVDVMDSVRLKEISGLDGSGMILVALLSGGDYDEVGVAGFGATLACEIARAGFGVDLIELVEKKDWTGLSEWRARLQYELETNESGHFKRKHKTLTVPETFPDLRILSYYTTPAVSKEEELHALESEWIRIWSSEIDVQALRDYTADTFDWRWRSGARRFVRCFAQPILQDRLGRGTINNGAFSVDSITERRQHFINDGIPELRLSAVPAEVVGLDIEAEEENPDFITNQDEENEDLQLDDGEPQVAEEPQEQLSTPSSPHKKRKSPAWDAHALEKWWIPEILLQLGLPAIVEDWHQLQRDIRADPKRFAARKASKSVRNARQIDTSMKTGAIRGFFTSVDKCNQEKMCLQAVTQSAVAEGTRPSSAALSTVNETQESQTYDDNALLSFTKFFPPRGTASTTEPQKDFDHDTSTPPLPSQETHMGSSFSAAITIDSSPVMAAESTSAVGSLVELDMIHVTQRKPKRAKPGAHGIPSSPPISPSRGRQTIESFFATTKSSSKTKAVDKEHAVQTSRVNNVEAFTSSADSHSNSKIAAFTRESLPGTWKEVDVGSVSARKGPRVSCVDLTGD